MNPPNGFDPILDLQAAINKYCELSPDRYAYTHYRASIEDVPIDGEANVAASWQWLYDRLVADKHPRPPQDIVDDGCTGNWWESWENS